MNLPKPRRSQRGFSLTEVVCAIAMVSATALPVLGVLSVGIADSQDAYQRRSMAQLRSTVGQLLQDPAWPKGAIGTPTWTAEAWFGPDGTPISRRDDSAGAVRVEMKEVPGLGYQSEWIEAVQVRFYAGDSRLLLGQCVQQRMRRAG